MMTDQLAMFHYGMSDAKFMSAQEKEKVLKHWDLFLRNGCLADHFTDALYKHLVNHCSFIAHYDRPGFYHNYFRSGDDAIRFLSQFDRREGCRSIEYGNPWWIRDGNGSCSEMYDINNAMVDIAAKYIPGLEANFNRYQKDADMKMARLLMAKHGIKPEF